MIPIMSDIENTSLLIQTRSNSAQLVLTSMFNFISIEFSLLFTGLFCIYWLFSASPRIQNLLLLLTSYGIIFLMAGSLALGMIIGFTTCIYILSLILKNSRHPRPWLCAGITLIILNLIFWKYFDFFRPQITQSLQSLSLKTDWLAAIILPLGISYYSFQSISYLVELNRQPKTTLPALSPFRLTDLALHLAFFTTVTAGPIARAQTARHLTDIYQQPTGMEQQINPARRRRILAPTLALLLILIALIKNWWFSGWIAEKWVDPVFANPTQYHSLEILAAIYGYTVQLFFDFSGYSDLMVALGLLLGFRLPVNFRAPLLAHNIREFWKRWHISLSTWIQDYIYIPLGGSRKGFFRTQLNLLSAMVLSGLWHGSGWHFLIWGALHGSGLVLLNTGDRIISRLRHCTEAEARESLTHMGKAGKLIAIIITLNFVCFCFVFFRAPTLTDALTLFQALLHNHINVPFSTNPLYFLSLLLIGWLSYPLINQKLAKLCHHADTLARYRYILPLLLILILLLICAPTGIPGFIYAKF